MGFLYIRYLERNSIFFPCKEIQTTPEFLGLNYQDINFKSTDATELNAWYIPAVETPQRGVSTILFCHGNAGNLSHRLAKIQIFHNLGLNLFIFDYRGYGKSKGSPSESGLYKDTFAAHNYLKHELKAEKIIGFGESLGAAAIIDLATKVELDALIIEEGFLSAKAMGKRIYPFVPAFVYSVKFDSINKIKNVKCPKLIIHSINDEIVPFGQGQALFEAAAEPKQFLEIIGAHNDAFLVSQEKLEEGIKKFLKEVE